MSANRRLVLGVFFVASLSILAIYTLFFTDYKLFGDPIRIVVEFPDANGLRDGDPVLVAGKRIGRVAGISYDPRAPRERRIRVEMNLDQPLEMLEGYRVAIEESTLLGGRNVDIDPGPEDGPPAEPAADGTYRGVVEGNPMDALKGVGELLSQNADELESVLANLDLLVDDLRRGPGLVGRLVSDEVLAEDVLAAAADLRATSADLRALVARAEAGEGTLGRLVADEALYEDALALVQDLAVVADDLQAGRGVLGALLRDDELAGELRGVVSDLRAVSSDLEAGRGLAGRLLRDPALAAELDRVVANVTAASEDLRATTGAIRGADGSLGKLIHEDELYDEALVALKLLTRSLEDYREAAPVSAFTSVLFGAF